MPRDPRAVAVLAWRLRPGRIAALTTAANVIAVVLIALTFVDIVPHQLSRGTIAASPSNVERPVAAPGARDVWFLVFDRYGNEHAMRDAAGVDHDLPEWLEQQGFSVARDAHANYGRTTLSLAATLNMTYLDDLAARMGPDSDDANPVNEMLQDHVVGRSLQARGYRYVHIGSLVRTHQATPSRTKPGAHKAEHFGTSSMTHAGATIDEMWAPTVPPSTICSIEPQPVRLERARPVSGEPGPKFVFGHVLQPHEPYVFKANGILRAVVEASGFSPAAGGQLRTPTTASAGSSAPPRGAAREQPL